MLFKEENRGATIIAHYFRGFDGLFILKYMLDNSLKVKVIKRGSQILDFQYKALQMNARDTLNLCALRLADFPAAVGLDHLTQKGLSPPRKRTRELGQDHSISCPRPLRH